MSSEKVKNYKSRSIPTNLGIYGAQQLPEHKPALLEKHTKILVAFEEEVKTMPDPILERSLDRSLSYSETVSIDRGYLWDGIINRRDLLLKELNEIKLGTHPLVEQYKISQSACMMWDEKRKILLAEAESRVKSQPKKKGAK